MSFLLILLAISCTSENPDPTIAQSSIPARKNAAPSSNEPFNPLDGKSLRDICSSYFLSLIKWRFAELQNNFNEMCCTKEALDSDLPCGLEWPFSDVPSCTAYDELQQGIYASYGRPFESGPWKQRFAEEPWYSPRDDYSEIWLSATAVENIETLAHRKKTKVHCRD